MSLESLESFAKVISKTTKTKKPLVIAGFPGIGLVGNISCQHIIEEAKMEYVGSIDSRYFPPLAVLFNGIVYMPVRIYESVKKNVVIIISDIPIHPTASYDISKVLVNWIESIGAEKVISIAGISTPTGERRVFGGATNPEMLDFIKEKTEIFPVGTVSGITGSIMTECYIRNIPAVSILGETPGPNPDPRAAVEVIKVLNELFDLSVETERLLNQAEQIELELSKLAEQVQTTETSQIPKKEFPMYG